VTAMKREYDFSKGERGKFFQANVTLNIPVYLEPENLAFVEQIAKKKKLDISRVVNELIKSDIQLAKVLG